MNIQNIKRARGMFVEAKHPDNHILKHKFFALSATLYSIPKQAFDDKATFIRLLSHIKVRVTDVLVRLNQIDYFFSLYKGKTFEDDIFMNQEFMALAIKDFHIDMSSLMDSLTPFIIHFSIKLRSKDVKSLPGFADITNGTRRSFRSKMNQDILEMIDSTEKWWGQAKHIRDVLTHREHTKIVFPGPADCVLFQVYDQNQKSKIVDEKLMWESGHEVVNFNLYSAYLVSEILIFMHEVAEKCIKCMGIGPESLVEAYNMRNFNFLIDGMDELIKI